MTRTAVFHDAGVWDDGTNVITPSGAPDASATVKGIVQLAGDLTGTAASPQIAAGVLTDAEIASANKDGAAGTPSLRTLGTGSLQATAGNDARLSDARTPIAHASTHQPGGSDALAVDAAAATGSLRTLGTGATQAAPGNDARFLPTDTVVVAGTRLVSNKLLTGDAQPAWRVFGNGKLEWGPGGSTAPDTNLYRNAAGDLRTDATAFYVMNAGGSWAMLGAASGTSPGLLLNGDTNLFRSGVGTLRTDGSLELPSGYIELRPGSAVGILYARVGGEANYRFRLMNDGRQDWGPGGGTAYDTVLYRSAASTLKTDGAFLIGGNIGFFGGAATAKQTVSGSRGGNAALASLLTALAAYGLVTNSSTA